MRYPLRHWRMSTCQSIIANTGGIVKSKPDIFRLFFSAFFKLISSFLLSFSPWRSPFFPSADAASGMAEGTDICLSPLIRRTGRCSEPLSAYRVIRSKASSVFCAAVRMVPRTCRRLAWMRMPAQAPAAMPAARPMVKPFIVIVCLLRCFVRNPDDPSMRHFPGKHIAKSWGRRYNTICKKISDKKRGTLL